MNIHVSCAVTKSIVFEEYLFEIVIIWFIFKFYLQIIFLYVSFRIINFKVYCSLFGNGSKPLCWGKANNNEDAPQLQK